MNGRRLTLLIALYVTLDFANPLMPGAVNFDPDESVEGVTIQHHQPRPQFAVVPTAAPVRAESREAPRLLARRSHAPALREWFIDLRQAHARSSDPPPLTEDH